MVSGPSAANSTWRQLRSSRIAFCLIAHPAAWLAWIRISNVTPEYSRDWAIIYLGIAVLATGTLNRLLTGWLTTQIAIAIVCSGVVFKERLLRQPLLAHDVVFFLRNVRDNVELLWAYPGYTLAGLSIFAAAIVAIAWCARQEPAAVCLRRVRCGFVHALLAAGSCVVVPKAWSEQLNRHPQFQDPGIIQAAIDLMDQVGANALPRFFVSFWQFEIVEPRDVPQGVRFAALAARAPVDRARSTGRPDIMVVLRESHANLGLLWGQGRAAPVPHPDARVEWHGEVRAHSFGGGTWLAEFSFLTGFYWADFGAAGSYAPFTLAPRVREALPVQLRRLGYRTIAFYPVHGTFLNARMAYRCYGFEEFLSSDELGLTGEWQHLSDRMIYSAALARLRQRKDPRPIFAFILTIKNHGPHNRTPAAPAAGLPRDLPPDVRDAVSDYLEREQETDRDFAWLQQEWLETPRPRMLAAFGDHWPSLEGGVLWLATHAPAEQLPSRQAMHTPVEMYANFPTARVPSLPTFDLAFLGGTVLEFAGLPPGDFFSANLMLRDKLGGAYADAPDPGWRRGYFTWANQKLGAWR